MLPVCAAGNVPLKLTCVAVAENALIVATNAALGALNVVAITAAGMLPKLCVTTVVADNVLAENVRVAVPRTVGETICVNCSKLSVTSSNPSIHGTLSL